MNLNYFIFIEVTFVIKVIAITWNFIIFNFTFSLDIIVVVTLIVIFFKPYLK